MFYILVRTTMHNYTYFLKIYIDEHITAYMFINNFDIFF